jgi:hypothetical protein
MADDSAIMSVGDTALWVAAFRAKENRRPDPAFHDPLASILAGGRGARIARSIPHAAMVGWAVVVRASAIDRLIGDALRVGANSKNSLVITEGPDPVFFERGGRRISGERFIRGAFVSAVDSVQLSVGPHDACTSQRGTSKDTERDRSGPDAKVSMVSSITWCY